MPKFDINQSRYAKFFESRDAANAFRILINDPNIIKANYGFWKTRFAMPNGVITRSNDGQALFSAKVRPVNAPTMLDMRSPLGESRPRDIAGVEVFTGSIPDFIAAGYVETAMEREDKQRQLEEYFGNDADIVAQYAMNIQTLVDEGNQTMNNMAAQMLSKGSITYSYGQGVTAPIVKVPIPVENFKNAGTVAWNDPSCRLLDQMRKIEEDAKAVWGDIPLVWDMPKSVFQVVLSNAQVVEYVKNWRTVNDKANSNSSYITESMFKEAFAADAHIAPILVADEAQVDNGAIVRGWDTGKAVLRPAGYAGSIKKASLLDKSMHEKYGSSVIAKVFADVDIFTVVNTTLNNGNYKEWHTDLMVAALPVLEEWPYHIIVDTTTAD